MRPYEQWAPYTLFEDGYAGSRLLADFGGSDGLAEGHGENVTLLKLPNVEIRPSSRREAERAFKWLRPKLMGAFHAHRHHPHRRHHRRHHHRHRHDPRSEERRASQRCRPIAPARRAAAAVGAANTLPAAWRRALLPRVRVHLPYATTAFCGNTVASFGRWQICEANDGIGASVSEARQAVRRSLKYASPMAW